ncbi:MAG: hypothetical protein KF817_03505 [Phycisphaeraceae bacterium]|nr:hypothetical protein [Phycisphaeraceae bacterium]
MASGNRNAMIVVAAGIAAGVLASSASAEVYIYRTVVRTGLPAPGTIGGTFTEFGMPSINSAGQVVFKAKTTSLLANSGIWLTPAEALGTVQMVAGTGYPFPSAPPDVRFGDFGMGGYPPMLNDSGNVGFAAPLTGLGDAQVTGLFRRLGGQLSKVAIPGDPAPGAGAGVTLTDISWLPSFSENDLMGFITSLAGPGINAQNGQAYYMHWFGGLTMLKRTGWVAPGVPGGTFGGAVTSTVQINSMGRTGFVSLVDVGQQSLLGIFSGWPAALSLTALQGSNSPVGMPFGSPSSLEVLSLTQNGTAFNMTVNDGFQWMGGLWYHNGKSIETIAYRTGSAPGGVYEGVAAASMTAGGDGTTAFRARFLSPAGSDTAIVRWVPGQAPFDAEIVVREGMPVYGWGTIQFDTLMSNDRVIVDDAGRVYFTAALRGPGVNASNDEGMWVRETDGTWHFVLRRGQWMMLDDNVLRQVDTFDVWPGIGMHSGFRPAVNNHGDIAIRVTFTDQTQAIIVASLPPTCPSDLDGSGEVDFADLLLLLAAWGACPDCPADLDGSGTVDFADVLMLLADWGPC